MSEYERNLDWGDGPVHDAQGYVEGETRYVAARGRVHSESEGTSKALAVFNQQARVYPIQKGGMAAKVVNRASSAAQKDSGSTQANALRQHMNAKRTCKDPRTCAGPPLGGAGFLLDTATGSNVFGTGGPLLGHTLTRLWPDNPDRDLDEINQYARDNFEAKKKRSEDPNNYDR